MSRPWLPLLLLAAALCEIVPLHRHVAQEIFQESTPSFTQTSPTSSTSTVLSTTSRPRRSSTATASATSSAQCSTYFILTQPHLEDYHHLLQYIGSNEQEYFLILDAAQKRKYLLPLPQAPLTRMPNHTQRTTCWPSSTASSTSSSSPTSPRRQTRSRAPVRAANWSATT